MYNQPTNTIKKYRKQRSQGKTDNVEEHRSEGEITNFGDT